MKKTIKALKFPVVFLLVLSSFIACDKDFSVVESDVLGEQNLNFKTDTLSFQIAAYNKKLEALQINGLSSNLLGVYNDPAYGQTIASIITQLTPTTYSPDFGDNTVIDSVVMSIPYFSRSTGTDANGNTTYTISDSLYGKKSDGTIKPFNLTIYQNNYFLRSFDPNAGLDETQKYYSKADGSINTTDNFASNGSSVINFDNNKGAAIYTNASFIPSSNPIKTSVGEGTEKVTTSSAPAFRTKLDAAFWKAAIIDKEGDAVLSNDDNFKNYFRGLYFKAEAVAGDGSMVLLNLASTNANITIHYSKDSTVEGERTQSTYVLNFTGNILNTFINNYSSVTLQDGDKTLGDEKLYLKGAEGSMAVVDLFSGMVDYTDKNGVTTSIPALEAFKKTYRTLLENGDYKKDDNDNYILKRFINDAQLIVYEDVDLDTDGNSDLHKYDRIYAYDLENNTQLIDYNYDPTVANTTTPYFSTYFHLGLRSTNAGISKYKIHLTEHLNNILLSDSTNTKIGLVLSSNVNKLNSAKIMNSSTSDEVTSVPAVSIITPRGTILYGTNSSVPANRKMKLKVFFTEPK
ncbi:DUF4270 domain-containing protein [Mariniflexile gromovii]|uniref:DUF4270 domain-containing protein n=1 Tax=Mariniflexile gromovii TaxID=362523 RepID=A0ABS4BQ66_9FLAO|nr:DUF4270 domain-containing protein [Mariniflexile gromovii]MBP0902738.1 DUF4270 domain-containing protein [Mariniflexile gromovii]